MPPNHQQRAEAEAARHEILQQREELEAKHRLTGGWPSNISPSPTPEPAADLPGVAGRCPGMDRLPATLMICGAVVASLGCGLFIIRLAISG